MVIDHDALVHALRVGKISGAALDVTHPEPLPRDHPLLDLPNVIITPHCASASYKSRNKIAQCVVQQMANGLNGKKLYGEITKESYLKQQ